MSQEKFQLGFIVGRFQLFHDGHRSLIEHSLKNAKRTIVLIGSSDKSRTESNPFTFEERKEMIHSVYPEVILLPLPDIGVGNVPAWGEYMLSTIEKNLGQTPDLYVCGKEDKVDLWFAKERAAKLSIHKVDRDLIPVSATMLRRMVKENDFASWKKYVPESMWIHFEEYRKILTSI